MPGPGGAVSSARATATAGGPAAARPGSLTVDRVSWLLLISRMTRSAGPGATPEMSVVTVVTPPAVVLVVADPETAGRPAVTLGEDVAVGPDRGDERHVRRVDQADLEGVADLRAVGRLEVQVVEAEGERRGVRGDGDRPLDPDVEGVPLDQDDPRWGRHDRPPAGVRPAVVEHRPAAQSAVVEPADDHRRAQGRRRHVAPFEDLPEDPERSSPPASVRLAAPVGGGRRPGRNFIVGRDGSEQDRRTCRGRSAHRASPPKVLSRDESG